MQIGEGKSRAMSAPLVGSSITEHVYRTIITARTAAQKWTEGITMSDADRCVCCGEIVSEGRQVCPQCERKRYIYTIPDIIQCGDAFRVRDDDWKIPD